MAIVYTPHLEFRLRIRGIPHNLPGEIFQQAKERYYDILTKHYIAIHQVEFKGKLREMVIIYDELDEVIEIITIHPIKSYQKYSRLISGRWKKV